MENKVIPAKAMQRILIEGNIACGKSTLLNMFENNPRNTVLPEPLEKWRNVKLQNGEVINLFEMLYNDPNKYQFKFQLMCQETMERNHNFKTNKTILQERSLYSEMYVFAKKAYDENMLNEMEYSLLMNNFKMIERNMIKPNIHIYLRVDPEIAYKRLLQRNRAEEAGVSLQYLKSLHKYHDDLYINNSRILPGNVIILNANKSIEELVGDLSKLIN